LWHIYGAGHDRRRPSLGTTAGRHRGRAPRRRAGAAARDLPLEGRRPRPGRTAGPGRRVHADPRRPAQAPGLGRGECFRAKLSGAPLGPPWDTADWASDPDWEFNSAADDTPEQLYELWDGAVEQSRATLRTALADGGLDQRVHLSQDAGRDVSLRRIVCDLIEEYGRHTGQADLLREAVDRLVGEDPPAGWRPRATSA